MTAEELLNAVAASGAAMNVLDSPACYVEAARPPATHPPGTSVAGVRLDGTLILDGDGRPVDEGAPARTLGDLIRAALG
jgi:hypothetical protein